MHVTRGPVVEDGEAADRALGPDDRRALELVVQLLRSLGIRHGLVRPEDRSGVREVEDRDLVPLIRHLRAALPARVGDVRLERHEVTDRRRMLDRRAQLDVGERVFRVRARGAAAREEGLQRLSSELDDAIAVDAPRPAALESELPRREHAQLHAAGA